MNLPYIKYKIKNTGEVFTRKSQTGHINLHSMAEHGYQIEILEISEGVEHLSLFGDNLTSLPKLPSTIIKLNCIDNKLTSFPDFPRKLKHFYGSYNNVTSLPKLSDRLEVLRLGENPNLKGEINLDELIRLKELDISDTKLILRWEGTNLPRNLKFLTLNNSLVNLKIAKKLKKELPKLEVRVW